MIVRICQMGKKKDDEGQHLTGCVNVLMREHDISPWSVDYRFGYKILEDA